MFCSMCTSVFFIDDESFELWGYRITHVEPSDLRERYPSLIRVIVKKGRNNPLLYRRFVISSFNCLLSMSMFFSMGFL